MHEFQLETLKVGDLSMRVATKGKGPLVLLCHGFPESWRSWRSQLSALAAAGYRAAAPDMRGYGGTDAPEDPDLYTMLHHAGDMTELVHALGESKAVIIGHDWGAPAAWNAALLRPDMFRAVAGLSVPYAPPGRIDLLTGLEMQGVNTFYMQYFQTPGVAEAELGADTEATIRKLTYSLSGDGPGRTVCGIMAPGARFLDATVEPETLPSWLDADDLGYVAEEFRRTGFTGGLNWYRSIRLTSKLMTAWRGCVIKQPSLFIAGSKDDVLKFPGMKARLESLKGVLPGLRGSHILEGAGHWIQRERAPEVNALLIAFLNGL